MNYESMSDFEISKAVAITLDVDGDIENITQRESKIKHLKGIALIKFKGYFSLEQFNPCNNPSDAWSIIIENKISIEYDQSEDFWIAHQGDYLIGKYVSKCGYRYQCCDKNPLRAAMIVFLMKSEQ